MKAKLIGEVVVDSGQLVIIDPGMAHLLDEENSFKAGSEFKEIDFPSAVSFIPGEGDGDYPVYALFDNDNDFIGVIVWFFEDVEFPFEIISK